MVLNNEENMSDIVKSGHLLKLSALAYDPAVEKNINPALPTGYEFMYKASSVLKSYDLYGYRGYAIINKDFKHVIIASSGTKASEAGNDYAALHADFQSDHKLIKASLPEQFDPLVSFTKKIMTDLGSEASSYSYTFTGHSLGAALSELAVAEFVNKFDVNSEVFDNPGTLPIIECNPNWGSSVAEKVREVSIIHNASPNVFNTLNPQTGNVLKLVYQEDTSFWRNMIYNDFTRDLYKKVAKKIWHYDEGEKVQMPGVQIGNHAISSFIQEIDPATNEFYEEIRVPKWNKYYKRSPLIDEFGESKVLSFFMKHNAIDVGQLVKAAQKTGAFLEQIGVWEVAAEMSCEYVGILCSDNSISDQPSEI